jgi:small-conductance mechanosensitive channel
MFPSSLALFPLTTMGGSGVLRNVGLTAVLLAAILLASGLLGSAIEHVFPDRERDRPRFWGRQAIHILALAGIVLTITSIWFRDPRSLGSAMGWVAAGVAVALQRVITAFAGYLILLRGKVFTVGDRITIGGVRGDVVALGFMQTTVMEMGQTPGEQSDSPSMWIRGRQYSGRIVRVTNDKIFDEPVFNYTRGFPFMWEEIMIPVKYGDDHARIERILLEAGQRHTQPIVDEAREALGQIEGRFFIAEPAEVEPKVYLRMTDNWIELSLRYLARSRGNRALSDAINREVLARMEAEKLEVGSSTYDIVGFPPVRIASAAPEQT